MNRPAAAWWLFVSYGFFVVYGSLVPLDYKALPLDVALERFRHIPFLHLGLESRADWVANGVLYAPLALLAARLGGRLGLPAVLAVGAAVLLCSALAVAVEFTQLFFPARTVSQNDILAEGLGSLLGAAAAPFLGAWITRLGQAWRQGGQRLLPRLLELYIAAYLLLCFFPYDLLLSAAELQGKVYSVRWGWLLAPTDRGAAFSGLQWLVEVALAAPVGALPWFQRPADGPRWGRALVAGLLLGLVIELGQFFVSSGVSQGLSVLSRGLGAAAGAALLPMLRQAGWAGVQRALRPWRWPLWALYLPLLAAVSGALAHSWQGPHAAWVSLQGTRLLPFYYHYYTTEALAMFSLGSVALMYTPALALSWAGGATVRGAALIAGVLALAVETGKLFVSELHADPTNIAIAVATVAAGRALLDLAQHSAADAVAPVRPGPPLQPAMAAALLAVAVSAGWALAFPVWPGALFLLLVAAVGMVWRWPLLALGLVPAALPLLDWAPWSGRFFWDEFDLLQTACLAVALLRTPAPARSVWRPLDIAWALLALSLVLSTLRALAPALWPLSGPDAQTFSSYYSTANALRIVKGAVWALLFALLWRRLAAQGERRVQVFSAGMAIGLTGVLAWVLWERAVFASLFDFAADFRVTGPFSAMHKGGAYIECYLAVAAAFAVAGVLRAASTLRRAVWLLLFAGAAYAMLVTYSRNGYAALAVVVLAALAAWLPAWRRPAPGRAVQAAAAAALLAALGLVAVPVLDSSYARLRLAHSAEDLSVRQAHWVDGLALRDGSLLTAAIGMGLGRFPAAHYWRSREPVHAGSYGLGRDGERPFLRLGQGAMLYIEQILPRPDIGALRVSMDVRGDVTDVPVLLCEKWTLTSRVCAAATVATGATVASVPARSPPADKRPANTPPASASPAGAPSAAAAAASASDWRHVEATLDASPLLAAGPLRAPLKLALVTPRQGAVEVSRVVLRTALGDSLLVNGDFAAGLDRWFFATDVDPPWHLHSLPLAVLFDQGWLGVLGWGAVLLGALAAAVAAAWRGDALVPAALPALLGFLASGTLNTLIDAPRFLWLLLVLVGLAALRRPALPSAPQEGGLQGGLEGGLKGAP